MTRGRRLDWASRRTIDLSRRVSQKGVPVSGSSMPPTIVVGDDDDDVHISSPRSFAQAKSSRQQSRSASESRASVNENRTEDPLELRLGPSSSFHPQQASVTIRVQTNAPRHRNDRSGTQTIDLTGPSPPSYDGGGEPDCILVNEFVQKKRKPHIVTLENLPEPAKELKLTCAICMDSMKEETSTICGHLFCRGCIIGAIAVQKKCPTCRQKLTGHNIHRIYISGSLRNP